MITKFNGTVKKIDLFSTLQPHFALSTTSLPYHLLVNKGKEKKEVLYLNPPMLGNSERYCFPRTLFNFSKVANAFLIRFRAQEAKVFKTDSCL